MNVYWMQSGGCGGDTMSFLNSEFNLFELFEKLNINILFHPSISNIIYTKHKQLISDILDDKVSLDIFCLEGNVVLGPDNSGLFDMFFDKPKKDLIEKFAKKAKYVLAVGTCASFGGFSSEEMQGVGLQFKKNKKGGFLGKDFISKSGYPVINIPGCPIHPKALRMVVEKIVFNVDMNLNSKNELEDYYNYTVHQGCTRNEYHEYKVEENEFGQRGCMFFHLGCKGPTTSSACNKFLWNEVNSKTRAGVPCFGCSRSDFPQNHPFFKTESLFDTPLELPKGVDRAHYLAYKDIAAAAAPLRLKKRTQKV